MPFLFILANIADFSEKQLESHRGLCCLVKRVNSLMDLHTNGTHGVSNYNNWVPSGLGKILSFNTAHLKVSK